MVGILLTLILAVALWAIMRVSGERQGAMRWILLGGFALRLVVQLFIRDFQFFSHEIGGDALEYEALGRMIATAWQHAGIHFVTQNEIPELGPTSLPPNLFALVIYLNDGVTRIGCTAVVASAAALAVLNVYKIALQFGASERDATTVAVLLYFNPTFLFYTSDMYKDGLVVCLAVGALASTIRLTFRLSVVHAVIGLICVAGLWYVRFYLVFVTVAPLVVGLVGFGSRSIARPIIAALMLVVIAITLGAFTDFLQLTSERASETFEVGTSYMVQANATSGGSSIEFDDGGSPTGLLLPKVAYTLFSPFLWSTGSLGFQVGKLDAVLWYYLIYRALRAIRVADRRLLLVLLTFIVPCTMMYAMSMANVGLIVRQRLVIVFVTAILSALYSRSGAFASAVHRTSMAATNHA